MLIYKTVHLTEVFDQTSFLFSFIRKNGCIKFKTFSKSYILIEEFFSGFFLIGNASNLNFMTYTF